MALTLNTGHPLFGNLKSFICVDGGVIKDLVQTGRTFTPHAAVTYGTNGYGEFFKTAQVSNNAQGVAFTPVMETCDPAQKTILVIVTDHVSAGAVLAVRGTNGGSASAISPGTFWTGSAMVPKNRHASWATTNGTVTNPTMVGFTRTGETSSGLVQNGTLTAQGQLYYNGVRPSGYIGGDTTGGYGGCLAASYNYIIEFDVALDATQVSDIYSSLGASGAISLLSAGAGTDASAPGATLTGTSSISAGSASGSGGVDATAPGATLTGTSSISAGSASGSGGSGTFTSDAMENNTGAGLLASTAVTWTWWKGAIGATPTSLTHGTGTTSAGGVLSLTGLPTGAGFLLVRTADSAGVYYQPGTVA